MGEGFGLVEVKQFEKAPDTSYEARCVTGYFGAESLVLG